VTFWTVFAAVFSANIMTGVFFWGLVAYSRHERDGTAGNKESNAPLLAALVPLGVLAVVFMVVFDKVPAWLDFILQ
jgi:hypothetical protein